MYAKVRKIQSKYEKDVSSRLKVAKGYSAAANNKIKELNKKVNTIQAQMKNKVKREAEQRAKEALKSKLPKF